MSRLHDHEKRVSPLLTRTEVRSASISIEKHVDARCLSGFLYRRLFLERKVINIDTEAREALLGSQILRRSQCA